MNNKVTADHPAPAQRESRSRHLASFCVQSCIQK
jgi:hypothetical protein